MIIKIKNLTFLKFPTCLNLSMFLLEQDNIKIINKESFFKHKFNFQMYSDIKKNTKCVGSELHITKR